MPELRKDPITGRWVIISTERGKRPNDFLRESVVAKDPKNCPFCAGNEAKTPPEVLVYGRKGEVDGDVRTDETEMLVLRADGTVQRTEQTVKTWMKYDAIRDRLRDKYRSGMAAGLSPDEIFHQIRASHPEGG